MNHEETLMDPQPVGVACLFTCAQAATRSPRRAKQRLVDPTMPQPVTFMQNPLHSCRTRAVPVVARARD
jgi:hypothetical protein